MPLEQPNDPLPMASRLPEDAGSVPTFSAPDASTPAQAVPQAIRIPRDLEVSAASRLVGESMGKGTGGRRMVSAAALHGIDLSLMWGTIDRHGDGSPHRARQVCLAVPGSGRTAMLVLSPPSGSRRLAERDEAERIAAVQAACSGLAQEVQRGTVAVRLAQALPDPREEWAVKAFVGAGFSTVGELAYLRCPLKRKPGPPRGRENEPWPEGISVRCVAGVAPGEPDRPALLQALDRTYLDTLDCPALCGLRETADILESHRATGIFDPRLWWLVFDEQEPQGCMLLSHIPDHSCVELVYLGLSPSLRGRGLGRRLLEMGMAAAADRAADHVACAVDLRNTPARRLYEQLGFREFGRRIALVRPIG